MLKQSTTTKLREAVLRNLPPRTFTVTNSSDSRTVSGYIKRTGELTSLDSLGFRRADARIHVSSGTLSPGDELDDYYVIWEPDSEVTFVTYIARRIPDFDEWTRRRRSKVGVDPVTKEPVYVRDASTFGLHLITFFPDAEKDMSGVNQEGRATGVTRAGDLLAGDDVSHPEYGTFNVDSVHEYGPWERVILGSA